MSAKIKLIRAIEYLQTSPEGEINFEQSKQLLTELAKAKNAPADYDVLLDFRRVQLNLSTPEIYFLAAELEKHDHTFHSKVAVLVLPGANFNEVEFLKLCSQNRGFMIKNFTNYEDAVQWFYEED
jgi:hypothetical protein